MSLTINYMNPEIDEIFEGVPASLEIRAHQEEILGAEIEVLKQMVDPEDEQILEALGVEKAEDPEEEAAIELRAIALDLAAAESPMPHVRTLNKDKIVNHPAVKLELAKVGSQEDIMGLEWYVLTPTEIGQQFVSWWEELHDQWQQPA